MTIPQLLKSPIKTLLLFISSLEHEQNMQIFYDFFESSQQTYNTWQAV
jgi:hypothetical protein